MDSPSQMRALKNYRKRLSRRGMARFEVLGLSTDRELVRAVARRLANETPEAEEMRAAMQQRVAEQPRAKGGILTWLRNSPLAGADLNLTRERVLPRKVDL